MRLIIFAAGLVVVACGGSEGGSKNDGHVLGTGGSDAGSNVSASGSGGGSRCPAGAEGCDCYGNGTCDVGLTCASNLCVSLGGAGGAGGIGGAGGATGSGGTGGAVISSGGSAGSSLGGAGGSQQCFPEGSICSGNATACCVGLTCTVDTRSPANGTCSKLCVSGSECYSGCCAPLTDRSASVCAPTQYCGSPTPSCLPVGSDCMYAWNSCCGGTACAYDQPSGITASCAAQCLYNSDCYSGCCAPSGTGYYVCSDPVFCGSSLNCLPSGTRPCGLGTECCPGSYCISDSINQICLPLCSSNLDCSTGCCATPNGNGVYVCTDPGYCGF